MHPMAPPIAPEPREPAWRRRQFRIFGLLALFWVVSDLAYYFGLPAVGIGADYNGFPIANAVFYLFWSGLAAIVFWPLYARWNRDGPWPTWRNRILAAAVWTLLFALTLGYVHLVVPALPPSTWPADAGPAPALVVATPAYFLPKTAEILFQQLLVVALIVSLSIDAVPIRLIMPICAGLFGGMHILLLFSEMPFSAVMRFTLAATIFGLILPQLVLKVRFGLAAAFALHWTYYAATLVQVRVFGPNIAKAIVGGG